MKLYIALIVFVLAQSALCKLIVHDLIEVEQDNFNIEGSEAYDGADEVLINPEQIFENYYVVFKGPGADKMQRLPVNFFDAFPRASSFYITWSVTQIETDDFKYAQQVRYLLLKENYLPVIGNSPFRYLTKLDGLGLEKCSIETIKTDAFHGLDSLRTLTLSHNELVKISADILETLMNLEKLDISHNRIETLPGDLFKYSPKFESLIASYNFISFIGADIFANFPAISNVYLNNNNLSRLNLPKIVDTADLRNLDLEELYIKGSVRKLLIGYNRLKSIDIEDLSRTEVIHAEHNEIESVENLVSAPNLVELNVKGNPFRSVAAFDALKQSKKVTIIV